MAGKIIIINDHGKPPYEAPKAPDIDSPEAVKFFGLDQMNDNNGNRMTIAEAREVMRKRFSHAGIVAKKMFEVLNAEG